MSIYNINSTKTLLESNTYPGRGIIVGMTPDGTKAVSAYFIMGRSENSRNRVFVQKGEEVTIYPFDESKVKDPSLIIYSPVRRYGQNLIVTNGNQTDTVYDFLKDGKTFGEAFETRCFEPDAPNYTPRISAILKFTKNDFTYVMSILKSADADGTACNRFTFSYSPIAGLGHFIHTYNGDGNPIPTFTGEPERVDVSDSIDEYTDTVWNSLDGNNKVSLFVRYDNFKDGTYESRIINKNK